MYLLREGVREGEKEGGDSGRGRGGTYSLLSHRVGYYDISLFPSTVCLPACRKALVRCTTRGYGTGCVSTSSGVPQPRGRQAGMRTAPWSGHTNVCVHAHHDNGVARTL